MVLWHGRSENTKKNWKEFYTFKVRNFFSSGQGAMQMTTFILPRCEYWTMFWWAAEGVNREKNLLDSSKSRSRIGSLFRFSLLLSSRTDPLAPRPKGRKPKVAASFVSGQLRCCLSKNYQLFVYNWGGRVWSAFFSLFAAIACHSFWYVLHCVTPCHTCCHSVLVLSCLRFCYDISMHLVHCCFDLVCNCSGRAKNFFSNSSALGAGLMTEFFVNFCCCLATTRTTLTAGIECVDTGNEFF